MAGLKRLGAGGGLEEQVTGGEKLREGCEDRTSCLRDEESKEASCSLDKKLPREAFENHPRGT